MILADTSAWIEYLLRTESETDLRVEALIRQRELATAPPVVMEILAGAIDDLQHQRLRRLLASCDQLATEPVDFEAAAATYRACRRGKAAIRSLVDCLVAAVAIREGVPVLHADADFDAIARHTALQLA